MSLFQSLTRSVAILLLLASCDKDGQQPVISSIEPASAVIGMEITINGEGFAKEPNLNEVLLNGEPAVVTSAARKRLTVTVPPGHGTGPVTVTSNGETTIGSEFRFYDVFVALTEDDLDEDGAWLAIKLWNNGATQDVTDGEFMSTATGLAVSGRDVFVVGTIYTDENGMRPFVWKNNQSTLLAEAIGAPSDILVDGGHVYIAGSVRDGSRYDATYWRDEAMTTLAEGLSCNDEAVAITLAGNDLYVAGTMMNDNCKGIATYWKNGSPVFIGPAGTYLRDIAVSGVDVYALGLVSDGNSLSIAYWKNGSMKTLSEGNSWADPISITISGSGDVIVGGCEEAAEGIVVKAWTNDQATILATGISIVSDIIYFDGHFFYCGVMPNPLGYGTPFVAMDDKIIPIKEGQFSGHTGGLVVR